MSARDEILARDTAHADAIIREVCAEFVESLRSENDVTGTSISQRYAAVPSWWTHGPALNDPSSPYAAVPSWCIPGIPNDPTDVGHGPEEVEL